MSPKWCGDVEQWHGFEDVAKGAKVTHLTPVNRKAYRMIAHLREQKNDVVALQQVPQQPAHIPMGCTLIFRPGWEADQTGGTAGLCQPVERDIFDCHIACSWPAQVPDMLNHSPDWTQKCAVAQKDWRKLDLVFPG